MENQRIEVALVWVPSHTGIAGCDRADAGVKVAARGPVPCGSRILICTPELMSTCLKCGKSDGAATQRAGS